MKIVSAISNKDILNGGEVFVESRNLRVTVRSYGMEVVDLTNALKAGKIVESHYIKMEENADGVTFSSAFYNWLDDWDINEFLTRLAANGEFGGLKVTTRERKGIETFSPFATVKPVKLGGKLTLAHIWKAILSGQVTKVIRRSRLTDDYAYDAETNFGRGERDKQEFARELIESKSGWWVSSQIEDCGDEIAVSVCCHHFDNNTVYIKK